ncbi:MAG: AAA family ATPase [Gammaproteobacteria bacterium]|nr:AAA family ATPase [Gammaproteobacteria bacterium]
MDRLILQKLRNWRDDPKRKPLIIKGPRQVGKTYILNEFGKRYFDTYHYFNFEKEPGLGEVFGVDLDPKRIVQELSLKQRKKIDYTKDLIIFDEIQACPKALTSLKYFCEDLPGTYLCCAGSLLGIHLGPVSYPVGKVDHLSMHPMSFLEFMMATGSELYVELLNNLTISSQIPTVAHQHLWECLKHYFIVGGLPEVVNTYKENSKDLFTAFNLAREKQSDLITGYFSDIAKHSGKINAMHINRVWQSIPEQLGLSQDGSAKKYKFKDVIPGIDRFSKMSGAIDWLESADLIIKVTIAHQSQLPLRSYTKENTFKLFIFDVGILGALSNLPPSTIMDYNYGSYKGYFAENFAAQAFSYSSTDQIFSWNEGKSEIEFLRQIDGHIIPVEVKSGWVTQAKSLRVYNDKYQPNYRVIMSGKTLTIDNNTNVHNYPLYLAAQFPLKDIIEQ